MERACFQFTNFGRLDPFNQQQICLNGSRCWKKTLMVARELKEPIQSFSFRRAKSHQDQKPPSSKRYAPIVPISHNQIDLTSLLWVISLPTTLAKSAPRPPA